MKIMHLLPSLSSGGVEQVVLELCRGMREHGVESVVVSGGGGLVKDVEVAGAKHYTRSIGKKSPATLWQVWRMAQLLRAEKPNILHIHSRVPAWVGCLAMRLLRREERPHLLTTFHGFYSVNRYSAIMTRGERIIAVSRFTKQHILEAYPSTLPERIIVIDNSIDLSEHNPTYRPSAEWLQRWRAEHPQLSGKYVLCLPSRITRWKGGEHLVPILAGLKALGIPAHIIIPGETKKGKEGFLRELKARFAAAGLSEDVTWLGLRRDIREIFCVSDVVLSLSLKPETFGKVSLEALALGRPVAGYAHGGVGEQLEQFLPEGMIPVGDTDAMAARLAEWYRTPPVLKKPVGSPYRREDMIQAHLELYHQLIS